MLTRVFFSREMGDYVVDQRCECGHLLSEHGSCLLPLGDGRSLRRHHDGNCCSTATDCDCPRFRWDGWVTATEMELCQGRGPLQR